MKAKPKMNLVSTSSRKSSNIKHMKDEVMVQNNHGVPHSSATVLCDLKNFLVVDPNNGVTNVCLAPLMNINNQFKRQQPWCPTSSGERLQRDAVVIEANNMVNYKAKFLASIALHLQPCIHGQCVNTCAEM